MYRDYLFADYGVGTLTVERTMGQCQTAGTKKARQRGLNGSKKIGSRTQHACCVLPIYNNARELMNCKDCENPDI